MDEKNGAGRRAGLRRMAAVAVLPAASLLAAACGGGSHPAGTGASTPPNPVVAMESYVQCMHRHGQPNLHISRAPATPDPNITVVVLHGLAIQGANLSSPGFQAANKTCWHLLGFQQEPTAELHQQFLQALKAARCMRAHGYPNWPDPQMRNGSVAIMTPVVDTSSPRFQSVAKACGEAGSGPGG